MLEQSEDAPFDSHHYDLIELCNTKDDELKKIKSLNAELLEALQLLVKADVWGGKELALNEAKAIISKAKVA